MRGKGGFVLGILDSPLVNPLAFSREHDILLVPGGIEGGRKSVLLPRNPAFTTIVDLGGVTGRGCDVGGAVQLNVRGARYEAFDVQRRKGDEVIFVVGVDVEGRMTDLLLSVSSSSLAF